MPRRSRFHTNVLCVIGLLVAALAVTIISGDHVGITIVSVFPQATGSSTTPIVIQFDQSMNRESVRQHFQVEPFTDGTFTWSGAKLQFVSSQPFQPGTEYHIILLKGMAGESGRILLDDVRFSFTIRNARIAYLAPADSSAPTNIWVTNPSHPSTPTQITFSPSGIIDFSISPSGNQIAFSEFNGNSDLSDIKLLDIKTGGEEQLTKCLDNRCAAPSFSPDGRLLAFEKTDFNTNLIALGIATSPSRVWIVDLRATPYSLRPLFDDNQLLGRGAIWSADGRQLAAVDVREPGVRVHNMAQGTDTVVHSLYGVTGTLSPDGSQLAVPEIDANRNTYLRIVDLATQNERILTPTAGSIMREEWSPNGQIIAIAQQLTGDNDPKAWGLYLVNAASLRVESIVTDIHYTNTFFSWDATSSRLLIQRARVLTPQGETLDTPHPEIWLYDLKTHSLIQIMNNAVSARWMP